MKAYQLKVSLKNSHPSIWRRCMVPAGLSFSQLAVILNQIMGWSSPHLSSFEFPESQITFKEQTKDDLLEDIYPASEYVIDTFIESAKWFYYLYDIGDYWEHRVQVEKVLTNYKTNYPAVQKYRGNTPYEALGHIHRYCEILETLQDSRDWEMAKYAIGSASQEYDMAGVNALLAGLYLGTEKSGPMSQMQIYQEMREGKPLKKIWGKRRVQEPPFRQGLGESKKSMVISGECLGILEGMVQKVEKRLLQNRVLLSEKSLKEVRLTDIFRSYRKEDLLAIAKMHELKGASKYTKAKLVDFLQKELLSPKVMRRYFAYFNENEYKLLKEAAQKSEIELQTWSKDARCLLEGGYCGNLFMEGMLIPTEVRQAYKNNCSPQWEKQRQEKLQFLYLANATTRLYGIFPIEEFLKQYQMEEEITLCEPQFLEHCQEIPENRKAFLLIEKNMVLKELNDPKILEVLGRRQKGIEFYPMSESQIRTLGAEGYMPFDIHMVQFQKFLEKKFQKEPVEAEVVCRRIQYLVRMGFKMENIFDYLQEALSLKEEMIAGFVQLLAQVWNFTGMICNRGYSPSEIARKNDKESYEKMLSVNELHQKKRNRIVDFNAYKEKKIR